jgi:demethylmenaquinone methyltransferase/2-methoxy-6-polyprenyl-1,4-benzoquinol methylase
MSTPKELVAIFFDGTGSSYDRVVNCTTFGRDKFWKRQIVSKISGGMILDLACGTGILSRMIAKIPNSEVVGVDVTQNYLDVAKKKSGFDNISYVLEDAEKLDLDKKFDFIVSSYIPKYCDAKLLIAKCVTHLNPGGQIILHDFVYPKSKQMQILWNWYFGVLQFLGNFIPSWRKAFLELPKLIESSNWVSNYTSAMKENGLDVTLEYHTFGCCCIITGKS